MRGVSNGNSSIFYTGSFQFSFMRKLLAIVSLTKRRISAWNVVSFIAMEKRFKGIAILYGSHSHTPVVVARCRHTIFQ